MDAEREARLADLLFEALERPSAERRAFLDAACVDDPALVSEVLAALDAESLVGDFLEQPAGLLLEGSADASADTTLGPPRQGSRPAGAAADPAADEPTEAVGRPDWQGPLGRRRLGEYRLIGLLGAGGMGQVYIGEDARLGRQVAVKILPPEMAARPDWLERFEREARALATLNHPGIVTIHSIEEDDGIRFLTMERVDGKTLNDLIPDAGMTTGVFLRIALELADALAAAHRRAVIHRDLKPANVMVTAEQRVKILDFGIAKVEIAGRPNVSREGQVLGTVAYMSPEQLLGDAVDARTDLFSLGIVMYQMATGKHPFPGSTRIQRITMILDGTAPRIAELRPDLPPEIVAAIERCMAKDPDDRYPDVEALVADLRALRDARQAEQFLESRTGWTPVALDERRAARRRWLGALVGVLALAVVVAVAARQGWFGLGPAVEPVESVGEAQAAVEVPARTPLAVLEFQNLSGDPDLDWLSAGIAELLITDLAQSPGLAIKTLAEVREATQAMAEDPADLNPESLRRLATDLGADALVRGSFARLGNILRIAYTLDGAAADPSVTSMLTAGSFEGQGEESLFTLVDQVGSAIFTAYDSPPPDIGGAANLAERTTSSVEAWRIYTQGVHQFKHWARPEEGLALLEQALEIDPEFALAIVSASKIYQTMGDSASARRYARRALTLAERLPLGERFNIEAGYYGSQWATNEQAIETYSLAVKAYPDEVAWRNNLARRYAFFERYDEALRELGILLDGGSDFWGDLQAMANARAALGDFETGYELLTSHIDSRPNHWLLQFSLAWHLTEWGRLDDAAQAFDRLEVLRPDAVQGPYGEWRLAVLAEDWTAAADRAERLIASGSAFGLWRGHLSQARNAIFRGDAPRARRHLGKAIGATSGAERALLQCLEAELSLALGDPGAALALVDEARRDGEGQWPELMAHAVAALASQALGQPAAADDHVETLRQHWRRQPNPVDERQLLRVEGLLALRRGDVDAAVDVLGRAEALLPVRGVEFSWHVFPDHVPVWVAMGEALLAAGRPAAAAERFERAATSGAEHIERPLAYVRSLGLAAEAFGRAGDAAAAERYRQRFLDHWPNGSLAGLEPRN